MSCIKKNIDVILWQEVRIEPLVWFRVIFGLLMAFSAFRFWNKGWIEEVYLSPAFHFKYYGFSWIKVLPESWIYAAFTILIISSLLFSLGFLYRLSAIVQFSIFTYIELIDKTTYLNHYYLLSLLALIMCFTSANRRYSLDSLIGICKKTPKVSAWQINLIKFQISCVYFFAGIAKINPYWLFEAQPLTNWLKHQTDLYLIGNLMKYDITAYIFSWTGCLFDLSIPFILLSKRFRLVGYGIVVIFHLLTAFMFPIGVFPYAMIALTTIFFDTSKLGVLYETSRRTKFNLTDRTYHEGIRKIITYLLGLYVLIQILMPFRHLMYSGNLFWTEQEYRFGWRVMLTEKVGSTTFFVVPENGIGKKQINNNKYLTPFQQKQMSTQPDMILEFAHYLDQEYRNLIIVENGKEINVGDPKIYVDSYVTLFNSGSRLFINPEVDLSVKKNNFSPKDWILPYEE